MIILNEKRRTESTRYMFMTNNMHVYRREDGDDVSMGFLVRLFK